METLTNSLDIKYEYVNNNDSELNPILELYRGKIYANILKSFIYNCINYLGTEIFSIKKSYPRTITNLLSSWFFTLYSTYDFSEDPFFPNNYYKTEPLYKTLKDFVKYNNSIKSADELITIIIKNLKNDYKNALINFNNYKKSTYYKEKKFNFKILKKIVIHRRNNKPVVFYKFEIEYPFKIIDKRQENIINNILIPKYIYDKLKIKYIGPVNKIDEYIWIIIYRYQLLGSNNNQLGVLPEILKKMNKDFNLNFECFASAINSTSNNYCSIYNDVEKFFGSRGNFFNLKPINGTFGFNPPYQKEVMDKGIERILFYLNKADKNNNNLTFIITIPIWDKLGKKIMKYNYPEKSDKPTITYDEFTSINNILDSKFFKAKLMISKDNFTYLDHNFHLFKNVTIQHTYILVLSNVNINFQEKLNSYEFKNHF